MAPVKPKGKAPKKGAKVAQKPTSAPPSSATKKKGKGPPPTQQKTKSAKSLDKKKPRKKQWTAEQLGVPKLNAITPIGVQKPRGKKKGKVFVDDPVSALLRGTLDCLTFCSILCRPYWRW